MTIPAAMNYAELTEAYLERGDAIDGMNDAIEDLNATIKQLVEDRDKGDALLREYFAGKS